MIDPPASTQNGRPGVRLHTPRTARTPTASEAWPALIQRAARDLGLTQVGFAKLERFESAGVRLADFVSRGCHGEMDYLARGERDAPQALLPEARSLIVATLSYPGGKRLVQLRTPANVLRAEVAGYAVCQDYHHVLKVKLLALADACADIIGRPVLARACVDTAPLLEREAARRAGVGFIGKSCMSIVPGAGSYFLLGELLTDIDLPASSPVREGCGSCRMCLDACPTGAFRGPHQLDARRCISYLTIEFRGVIPRELRPLMGRRVFGCDVCQDVCPFNATNNKPLVVSEMMPRPQLELSLSDLLGLTASGYRRLTRHSALSRATRRMLQRNAAIALGNSDSGDALAPLLHALAENSSALVRGHAAWGVGRIACHAPERARQGLERAVEDEDPFVRAEAEAAIASLGNIG